MAETFSIGLMPTRESYPEILNTPSPKSEVDETIPDVTIADETNETPDACIGGQKCPKVHRTPSILWAAPPPRSLQSCGPPDTSGHQCMRRVSRAFHQISLHQVSFHQVPHSSEMVYSEFLGNFPCINHAEVSAMAHGYKCQGMIGRTSNSVLNLPGEQVLVPVDGKTGSEKAGEKRKRNAGASAKSRGKNAIMAEL
ncbi:hypothetical protein E4U57_003102 [Claviceps arundinis]|uniref:Uncharacterized protein n=1 Tax=Claviceps arundinis TaxID=1623583 RepID=A0A9P7SMF7_9HYPO|nr:hypothetical protein E4U57_003102 [Claviceps arundinis]KAG5959849.1 hypothetical protein E4U56_004769 [Claviceps arundinis]